MDRIGRLLGNVWASPVPNGNGAAKAVVQPPAEQKGLRFQYPSVDFVPVNSSGDTVRLPSGSGWYAASWLAYACMRYRATKLVEPPLWITEENEGDEAFLQGGHAIERLLQRPNPDMSMGDLLELTSLYLDMTPGCVWHKVRGRSNLPERLYPYSGDEIRVESATVDGVPRIFGRYKLKTSRGWSEWIPPEDVVHFRNANPGDVRSSLPPLDAALARLGIEAELQTAIKHGLKNSIRPSASIEFPSDFNPGEDSLDEFISLVKAKYAGSRQRGDVFVSGGGGKLQQHDVGLKGLDGGNLSMENEAAVCAVFQVPPAIAGARVGLENSSDRHNMETAVSMFYDNMAIPTWAKWEDTLTVQLLRDFDKDPKTFLRFDKARVRALQEDIESKAKTVAQLRPELDLDERRALLGYPPATPEQREEIAVANAPANPFADLAKTLGAPAAKRLPPPATKDTAANDLRWAIFDASTKGQETGWELAARAQIEKDRDAVLAVIEGQKAAVGPAERKDDDPATAEEIGRILSEVEEALERRSDEWLNAVRPLTDSTARRAIERIAAELAIDFELLQPGLLSYVQREAAWLVTQVTDTTKQGIRDALDAGLAEGESITKLAERIRESGTFSRSRSELIARTETTRVTNGGQRESLQAYQTETGRAVQKTWLSSRDARVRDEHIALDGETVGIASAFSNGLTEPSEPNCRCTLIYSTETSE